MQRRQACQRRHPAKATLFSGLSPGQPSSGPADYGSPKSV